VTPEAAAVTANHLAAEAAQINSAPKMHFSLLDLCVFFFNTYPLKH